MRFVNLTPHAVNVLAANVAGYVVFQPSGVVARCSEVALLEYRLRRGFD